MTCECGCGTPTRLALQTDSAKGWVKGEPLRFARGHANRTKQRPPLDATDYTVEDRGYSSPCWIWNGRPNNKGYGSVTIAGRSQYAHRAMYEQEVGLIPSGLELDHLCRVTICVRPEHLDPVKHAVNLRRGAGAKLSEAEVEAIRRDPRNHVEVAVEFGVSASHVCRLRAGQRRRIAALSGAVGIIAKDLDA